MLMEERTWERNKETRIFLKQKEGAGKRIWPPEASQYIQVVIWYITKYWDYYTTTQTDLLILTNVTINMCLTKVRVRSFQ